MTEVFISSWRFHLFRGVVTVAFLAVLGRLTYLHIFEQENLSRIVAANRHTIEPLTARRGNIFDCRGNLLASTRPIIELGADPQVVRDKDRLKRKELAALLEQPSIAIETALGRKTRPVPAGYEGQVESIRWVKLAEKVDEPTYQKILGLKIKGVYGNRHYERYYPGGQLAAHLLGYIGFVDEEDAAAGAGVKRTVQRPLMGVEKFMDFYLRGQDGYRETEHDGRRRELAQYRREFAPVDGLDIELTIDYVIQSMVEEEIRQLVDTYRPQGVTIIVSEPATGAILALANHPSFDPNEFWKSDTSHLRNRAFSDVYEPGSTFKIVAISGALQDGLVTPETRVNCSLESVERGGRKIRLPNDTHPLGVIPVREIVAKSSNRGAAQLGMKLGERRMYEWTRAFGFGEPSGYGPGGEVTGLLQPVARWDGLTISRLPAGYAVGATPWQVHSAMSVIASGGVLMAPMMVRQARDREGQPAATFAPRLRRRVLDPSTAATMARLLSAVVSPQGTAPKAAIEGFTVAGKTGTARKIIDGHYSDRKHVASFTGFFPVGEPRLVMTIVVDEPHLKGIGYGGIVAAPSFHNIGSRLAQYLSLQPEPSQPPLASAPHRHGSTHP